MNIVVLGPGAIGSLWACYLKHAGHNVSCWSHTHSSERDYLLTSTTGSTISRSTFVSNHIDSLRHADVIFVATKAHQVATAILPLIQHIDSDTILLFMHNGMGTLDELLVTLSAYPILRASTSHAALKHNPCHVQHTGLGKTDLGGLNPKGQACQFMAEVLSHALPDVNWHSTLEWPLWRKVAINCVINPLTAIDNIKNGALLGHAYTDHIHAIVREIVTVMQASGLSITQDSLLDDVYAVLHQTAHNYSSMHQDISHQRTSEIDFINGYVVNQAQQHAISTPYNIHLWQTIKQLEHRWSHL
ncbi:2-dehydropantoate 2-reductase [Vibrio palustris]|uniref:2-dehydropantoate 2-reductase n=1 Tax=Vibrio palustris TaxID=1918946 RepID=A0A1R4AZW2_9VIBR|nr:2-dehydropantoate 2-reductase [Vibrio palustris]SJL82199.1 2-dehydropantoate 2-reductase [Vibrio palustris]